MSFTDLAPLFTIQTYLTGVVATWLTRLGA
jgi:hypothetical protein